MTAHTGLVTAEQLLRDAGGRRCELINGEVTHLPFSSFERGQLAVEIGRLLGDYVADTAHGVVCGAETGFVLSRNPDTVRAPDAAFVRTERAAVDKRRFFEGPPDLAVEVVSPNDRMGEVDAKARHWIEAGAKLVWVLWPHTRSVTVYRPDGEPQVLHDDDKFDGEDVLPGFTHRVGDVFG